MSRTSILNLIKKSRLTVPSGASAEGDLQQRIRSLIELAGHKNLAKISFAVLPGDNMLVAEDKNTPDYSMAAPIASDVWYLSKTTNALPEDEELRTEILEGMKVFTDELQGIKPLRTTQNNKDLTEGMSQKEIKNYFDNNGVPLIKEMRFEQIPEGNSFEYPSDGEEADHAAFLAFPVGQLGVMENQSLVSESMIERGIMEDTTPVIPDGGFMAPVTKERNTCPGKHIINTAYLKTDDKVEHLSEGFKGQDNFPPHRWKRYWINKEDTWPIPGEFVGLACKSLPYHASWFQETSPFLYSGNWFDTNYYTSGTITEVIEDAENEETNIYKVKTRGLEQCLRPNDFSKYEVGDRVAIVKKNGNPTNFNWTKLDTWEETKTKKATGSTVSCDDLVIIPVTFYEQEV